MTIRVLVRLESNIKKCFKQRKPKTLRMEEENGGNCTNSFLALEPCEPRFLQNIQQKTCICNSTEMGTEILHTKLPQTKDFQ
jgi:hypothetical protein